MSLTQTGALVQRLFGGLGFDLSKVGVRRVLRDKIVQPTPPITPIDFDSGGIMADEEMAKKIEDLEKRIKWLEMQHQPVVFFYPTIQPASPIPYVPYHTPWICTSGGNYAAS